MAIDNGSGGILPSMLTVQNGSYQPLSRPLFIYVNAKSAGKPEVREFVIFYMQHAQQLVEEVRYFPLKKEFYDFNLKHLQNKTLGTVFGGEAGMGISIEDLYKRERVQ